MRGKVLRVLLGTVVFTAAIARPEPLDVAVGILLCLSVEALAGRHLRAARPAPPGPPLWRRAAGLPGLAWATMRDVVRGTVEVALVSLRPARLRRPGFVEVELGCSNDAGVLASALLTTLSPGSFVVDVSPEDRTMVVHVLDATDEDAVRARAREFYDRHQSKVLP